VAVWIHLRGGEERPAAAARRVVHRPAFPAADELGHHVGEVFGREELAVRSVADRALKVIAKDVGPRLLHRVHQVAEHLGEDVDATVAPLAVAVAAGHLQVLLLHRPACECADGDGQEVLEDALAVVLAGQPLDGFVEGFGLRMGEELGHQGGGKDTKGGPER